MITREELKEVIAGVIRKMESGSPEPACGLFWADNPQPTTKYAIGEEDPTTEYAVGEEDPAVRYGVVS